MSMKRSYPEECQSFLDCVKENSRMNYRDCLEAIHLCPELFYEIKQRDHRLFLEIIKCNPLFLKEIYQPTDEMVYEALRGNPLTLKYIRRLTEERIKLALQRDFSLLKEVEAVEDSLLEWMKELRELKRIETVEIPKDYKRWELSKWEERLKVNGLWLKYLSPDKQTFELCQIAVEQNPKAIMFASQRDYRMCRLALNEHSELREFSPYHFEWCREI